MPPEFTDRQFMSTRIIQQTHKLEPRKSTKTSVGELILSLRSCDYDEADLVIGSPGLPNLARTLRFGDAVLYETPTTGIIEIRAMGLSQFGAELLVTEVSPRLGLAGALSTQEAMNEPFAADELVQIKTTLKALGSKLRARTDVSPEQSDLLERKLDEIITASERLGRKDWTMFVAGTLTNVVVGAAFSPEAAKDLFSSVADALGWVLQNALRLLP